MKETTIMFMLTKAEKETVRQTAKQQGVSISTLIRESIGLPPSNKPRSDF